MKPIKFTTQASFALTGSDAPSDPSSVPDAVRQVLVSIGNPGTYSVKVTAYKLQGAYYTDTEVTSPVILMSATVATTGSIGDGLGELGGFGAIVQMLSPLTDEGLEFTKQTNRYAVNATTGYMGYTQQLQIDVTFPEVDTFTGIWSFDLAVEVERISD